MLSAQQVSTQLKLDKLPQKTEFLVEQAIQFTNTSNDTLFEIKLLDWNHAFSDKNSTLAKRFLENYEKKFQFTIDKNLGKTDIKYLHINGQSALYKRSLPDVDIITVSLEKPLLPNQKIDIQLQYILRLPHIKFTGYGADDDYFHLRFWYIIPAVYEQGWQTLSHLDMDDQYHPATDFLMEINLTDNFFISSNLQIQTIDHKHFILTGQQKLNAEIILSKKVITEDFTVDHLNISTNLKTFDLDKNLRQNILQRQINFLKEHLGDFPNDKLLITQELYSKYPLYGFNQLPGFLRPFSDTFEWDIRMLQTLSKVYLQESLTLHPRKNAWLQEGLVPYLMLQYVQQYYPDYQLFGNISKIWGVKSYHFATLKFNERYLYGYQSVARNNNDQAITTDVEKLSNFNRLVGTKFKSALALQYLDNYLKDSVVNKSILQFYSDNNISSKHQLSFQDILQKNTTKPTNWFFEKFIQTDLNVKYKLLKPQLEQDSIKICYKSNFTEIPVELVGKKDGNTISTYWLYPQKRDNEIKLPYQWEQRFFLNDSAGVPEVRLADNRKYLNQKFIAKPFKFRLFSDFEDYDAYQIFLEPKLYYNYYDGFLLSSDFLNKTFFRKNIYYKISPSYGLKSQNLTGSFVLRYTDFPHSTVINNYSYGISGGYSYFAPELIYRSFTAFGSIAFQRKNFRTPFGKGVGISYTMIDKDFVPNTAYNPDAVKYSILNLNYSVNRPELINKFYWTSNWEISNKFSKVFTDIRFRKLTNDNQQFEVRGFLGLFLYNTATTDYFSFAANRPTDYLFRYQYFGRSETSGIYSQQFIMNEAGFIAEMPVKYANQWLSSINTSVGIWRWLEIYTNVGWAKNRNQNVYFMHDKGIRLNFINDFLEVYFPLHSNKGWETASPHYEQKIRFVFTANFKEILGFFKRGFM